MEQKVGLAALCAGLGIARTRAEKWISDGDFKPVEGTIPGRARLFGKQDAMRLAVLARLTDMRLRSDIGRAIEDKRLHGYRDQVAYLIVRVNRRNLQRAKADNFYAAEDVGHPFQAFVCNAEEIAAELRHAADSLGLIVLNLDEIEHDVDRAMAVALAFAKDRG